MKIGISLLWLGCLCFVILGCDKGSPTPVDTVDKIKILAVTPTTGLANGQTTNFIVTVNYNLYSKKTGTLMIGFNNGSTTGGSVMLPSANKIIDSGSGESTFNVSATVKNWGTQADFFVYVNLSENPIPVNSSWTPFANDHFVLIAKQ